MAAAMDIEERQDRTLRFLSEAATQYAILAPATSRSLGRRLGSPKSWVKVLQQQLQPPTKSNLNHQNDDLDLSDFSETADRNDEKFAETVPEAEKYIDFVQVKTDVSYHIEIDWLVKHSFSAHGFAHVYWMRLDIS